MAKKKPKKPLSAPLSEPSPGMDDDDGLLDDLVAQIDGNDTTSQETAAAVISEVDHARADELEANARSSKDRWKARQLRKQAERVAQYAPTDTAAEAQRTREIEAEKETIERECERLGLIMHEINPDGHCLYSAIADQLKLLDLVPSPQANYVNMRHSAATYMERNKDFFLPFLPSMSGEDGIGADRSGLMTENEFANYCQNVRSSSLWGGQPEITALSHAFNVPIRVIQYGEPVIFLHDPNEGSPVDEKRVVNVSYHRRMYGLGEHYNSLRPKSLKEQLKQLIR